MRMVNDNTRFPIIQNTWEGQGASSGLESLEAVLSESELPPSELLAQTSSPASLAGAAGGSTGRSSGNAEEVGASEGASNASDPRAGAGAE